MLTPYLLLGTIVKPQGIRGEVKLHHETDDPARFAGLDTVYLKRKTGYEPVALLAARAAGDDVFLTLAGVDSREAAEALRGENIYVDRAHARALAENEAFIADMIGLAAVDTAGNAVGTLENVLQNGGTDVLVFATGHGRLMAPFLKRLVITMDVEARRMVLDRQTLAEVGVYENSDSDHLS